METQTDLQLSKNEILKYDFDKLSPELKANYIAIKQYETTVTKIWFDIDNKTIGRQCKRRIVYRINPVIIYTETIDFVFDSDVSKIFPVIEKIAVDDQLGNLQKIDLIKTIIEKFD